MGSHEIWADVTVPFNRPYVAGNELPYIQQALESGHLSGDGPFSKRCSAILEQLLGAPRVLLTTSGTHALDLAALLLDLSPGDEVILPSFTFPSTANAFVLRGARPIFVDIRADTLNIDESKIEAVITSSTKVIVPVHYAGVGCDMSAILEMARRYHLEVVEDNAHGLFGAIGEIPLGTFGALAALSFHETKNVSCGEGGALVVNDASLIDRAEIIREKGTDRSRFFRGEVDRYTWVDVGSSFLPSDLLAAFLLAQLEARQQIQARRRSIWERYNTELSDWAAARGVGLPFIPPRHQQTYHMFYLVMPTATARAALLASLRSKRVLAVFHYQPLHLSAMGRRSDGGPGACPVAEDISERLVRLPFYTGMTEAEQALVISAVRSFRT